MFKIKYRMGDHVDLPSLNEALRELRADYPELYARGAGEGRTLVWASVEESEDDDGARAVAEILKVNLVRYAN